MQQNQCSEGNLYLKMPLLKKERGLKSVTKTSALENLGGKNREN